MKWIGLIGLLVAGGVVQADPIGYGDGYQERQREKRNQEQERRQAEQAATFRHNDMINRRNLDEAIRGARENDANLKRDGRYD